MTNDLRRVNQDVDDQDNKRDWRVSAILIAIWVSGMMFVLSREMGIPNSMLLIASAFFIILLPAMNDLVRSIERKFGSNDNSDKNAR